MDQLSMQMEGVTLEETIGAIVRLKITRHQEKIINREGGQITSGENLHSLCVVLTYLYLAVQEITKGLQRGSIVKTPKKGDPADCNEWRGIKLFTVQGKGFCSIILLRIRKAVDARRRDEKAEYRPRRSCTDQMY